MGGARSLGGVVPLVRERPNTGGEFSSLGREPGEAGGCPPRPRRLQGALLPPVVAVWESKGVRGRTVDVLDRLERPDQRDTVPHAP